MSITGIPRTHCYADGSMMYACIDGDIPAIRLWLRKNININALCYGETDLMRIARDGNLNAAGLLVAHGATVDILDKNGYSALAMAARDSDCRIPSVKPKNYYGVCEFLIAMGADRDVKLTQKDIIRVTPDIAELLRTPLSLQRLCYYHIWVQLLKE